MFLLAEAMLGNKTHIATKLAKPPRTAPFKKTQDRSARGAKLSKSIENI